MRHGDSKICPKPCVQPLKADFEKKGGMIEKVSNGKCDGYCDQSMNESDYTVNQMRKNTVPSVDVDLHGKL